MRSKVLSSCLLVALASFVHAQSLFIKTLGGYANDEMHAIASTADGNLLVAGTTGSLLVGAAPFCGWLTALSPEGDTLWSRSYTPSSSGNVIQDLLPLPSGEVLCVGSAGGNTGWLMRTDASGIPLASFSCSDVWNMQGITKREGSGYYAVGSMSGNASNITLFSLNDALHADWSVSLNTGYEDISFDVVGTPDSGAVVAGSTRATGTYTDALLFKVSKSGELVWSKAYGNQFPGQFNSVITCADGGLLATGTWAVGGTTYFRPLVVRLNDNGDTLWTRSLTGYPDGRGMQAIATAEGFTILADLTPVFQNQFDLTFLDQQGERLGHRTFGSDGKDYPIGMVRLDDGRYATLGTSYLDPKGGGIGVGANDALLAVVGPSGTSSCEGPFDPPPTDHAPFTITAVGALSSGGGVTVMNGVQQERVRPLTTLSCSSATSVVGIGAPTLALFPDPAKDRLTVRFIDQRARQVMLIDMLGRTTRRYSLNGAGAETTLDLSGIKGGTYTVIALDDEGRRLMTGRAIVLDE